MMSASLRLWWRTARFGPLLIAACLLAVAQRWLPAAIGAPQLRSPLDAETPTAVFVSSLVGIIGAYAVIEPVQPIWLLSPAPSKARGAVRVVLLITAYLTLTAFAAPTWQPSAAGATLTAAAWTLLMLQLADRRVAWLAAALHATTSALLGRQVLGDLSWWAWPASHHPAGLLCGALAVLVAALVVLAARRQRI